MIAQSYTEDYQVSYLLDSTEVRIPAKKKTKELILLGFWLFYWFIILGLLLAIAYSLYRNIQSGGKYSGFSLLMVFFFSIGLISWGFRGWIAFRVFLLQIAGVEIIQVGPDILRIRKTIFGIGRTKQYKREQIKGLSVAPPLNFPFAFTKFKFTQFEIEITGPLYVQHEGRKWDFFGFGLDIGQADRIATILKQRLKL